MSTNSSKFNAAINKYVYSPDYDAHTTMSSRHLNYVTKNYLHLKNRERIEY